MGAGQRRGVINDTTSPRKPVIPDHEQQCYAAALRLLSVRARSVEEARRRLRAKGFRRSVTERTLERLSGQGYLDDEDFAHQWVESRQRRKPRSTYALEYELKQRGIDAAVASRVLADIDDDQAAQRAATQKMRQLSSLPAAKVRARMIRFLKGRGFDYGTASRAANQAADRVAPGVHPHGGGGYDDADNP